MQALVRWCRNRIGNDERGVASVFVAITVIALLGVCGLILDGTTKIRAAEEATSSAQEAARAAGQALTPNAITGHAGTVDPAKGAAAARSYLAQAGVPGNVTISGTTITITTHKPWHPALLGAFGVGSGSVTGTATVHTVRTQ